MGCQQENKEGGFRAVLLQTPVIIVTSSSGTKMHVHNRVWLLLIHKPPSLTSVGQRWNKEVNNVSGPFGKKSSPPPKQSLGKTLLSKQNNFTCHLELVQNGAMKAIPHFSLGSVFILSSHKGNRVRPDLHSTNWCRNLTKSHLPLRRKEKFVS